MLTENLWEVNDRVWAKYSDNFWYPATITDVRDGEVHANFDDETEDWVSVEHVKQLGLYVGMPIECKFKDGEFYAGTLAEVNGNSIVVDYDDGDNETTNVKRLRAKLSDNGQPWEVGQRVWAHYSSNDSWYVGRVQDFDEDSDKVDILFDDGDETTVKPHQVAVFKLADGQTVLAPNESQEYETATVVGMSDEDVQVEFENGNVEWVPLGKVTRFVE